MKPPMADGDLDQGDFDIAFAFTRPNAAAYRNAAGAIVLAGTNAPRFDHLSDGTPRGLLVQPGQQLGQADRVRLDPLMLPEDLLVGRVTILHALDIGAGIVRRAWYSENAKATIDACMSIAGHHVSIGLIAGYRARQGSKFEPGFVRYRRLSWSLTRAIAATQAAALADDDGRPLIGA
jgi:hypothetical protein